MKNIKLNYFDSFRESLSDYKNNFNTYFITFLLFPLISLLLSLYGFFEDRVNLPILSVIGLLSIISIILHWAGVYIAIHKGKTLSQGLSELFTEKVIWLILLFVLNFFLLIGSLAVFIIPGIIISQFVIFATFIILDSNKTPLEAMITSWQYVRHHWWSVLLYFSIIPFIFLLIPRAIVNIFEYSSIYQMNNGSDSMSWGIDYVLQIIFSSVVTLYLVNIYKRFKAHSTESNHTIDNKTIRNIIIGFSVFGIPVVIAVGLLAAKIAQYFLS